MQRQRVVVTTVTSFFTIESDPEARGTQSMCKCNVCNYDSTLLHLRYNSVTDSQFIYTLMRCKLGLATPNVCMEIIHV